MGNTDWVKYKLGDVFERISNGFSGKQYEESVGFPITRIETISNETVNLNRTKHVLIPSKEDIEKYKLNYNDILFSHINSDSHLGKTAIFKRKDITILHGINLLLLRPAGNFSPDFLKYYLKYLRYKGTFIHIAQHAVNQSSINQKRLKSLELFLPTIGEQQHIVEKIEELFSELDNGIANLENAKEQLKVYRQSVLKWAFEGRLIGKQISWSKIPLGDIIKIKSGDGLTSSERVETGKCNVYGGNGWIGRHDKHMFEQPQLIIGRVGVNCGNTHITKPMSWVTDNAFIVTFDRNKASMFYLYYLIKELNLNKYSVSTAQPVISGSKVYPIQIMFPPFELQSVIVQEIEARFSLADQMEQSIEESLQQAEALRQSILKSAFEGRLV